MQEADDGSRTTGWAKEGLVAWGESPFQGERWREIERDRETQGKRERSRWREREKEKDRNKGRRKQRKVDSARKKKEKLFKPGQSGQVG